MSQVFEAGKTTIGLLGGGQLGRMMTAEARRLGYRVLTWVGGPNGGPADWADVCIEESFDSPTALDQFLREADVATVEFENIPRSLLERVATEMPLRPGVEAIATCQHREREKNFLTEHRIPCTPFSVVDSVETLEAALQKLPDTGGILKTAEFGYDGKGQVRVSRDSNAAEIWDAFDTPRAVLEDRVSLASELSVIVARNEQGGTVSYDPVENFHANHILDVSIAPARISGEAVELAGQIAIQIAEAFDYIGIMTVEFFLSDQGELLVNEMAPRPHNSGHHTINACDTSQFEQQLRAVCGLPLGSPRTHSPSVMQNLLGDVWNPDGSSPDWCRLHEIPGASLHLYGKNEAREGRKMGHVTIASDSLESTLGKLALARAAVGLPVFEG